MDLIDLIKKQGSRVIATKLIDRRVVFIFGLSLSDLPDTSEVCSLTDNIEGILDSIVYDNVITDENKELLKNELSVVDLYWIEDQIMG
jgi:hypothetical protein